MLKYEVPVVYDIIMYLCEKQRLTEPPYLLVKTVCDGSSDPSLIKPKYYRYLEEYLKNGVCCKRGKKLIPKRAVYYNSIREKKLKQFIVENDVFLRIHKMD